MRDTSLTGRGLEHLREESTQGTLAVTKAWELAFGDQP